MKKTLLFLTLVGLSRAVYYGTEIGDFANRFHNVKGKVYAVDSRTIFIKVNSIIFVRFNLNQYYIDVCMMASKNISKMASNSVEWAQNA